jgi:apolipoprotein N-acyltransferase
VLHAAISGISAVIDADGRVVRHTGLFEREIVEGRLATTSGTTPFVRFGDWVVAGCLLGVLGTAGFAQRRWVRSGRTGSESPPVAPVD